MASAGSSTGDWSEERVERELRAWFAEQHFDVWPPYRTFVAHGRKRLHAGLVRHGGPERWAPELGVAYDPRPGGGLRDADIAAALRALVDEHALELMPTLDWMTANGPRGFAAAVRRTGGPVHWARELGLKPRRVRWTDELIEAELRRVCAHTATGRWPTKAEFQATGATGVMHAVYAGHGSHWWARKLGLPTAGLRARRGVRRG